ncbi:DUF350 domain-containing protein [Flammeovirga sp. SJP92]|uniref:DUF350 domain-containing protein n=1 Tax=Flammeovirga sp. SJP92 TaxID=1775430 RepID=UPI00078735D4|nr:DUF350 domain-containing protein [Flammeovirga sp. SJP92]KXX72319.1 hypothetical protein AVL50_01575 [Flammeovirga sp. SJP92]
MKELLLEILTEWGMSCIYILIFAVILLISKFLKKIIYKDNVDVQLTEKDNVAYGISIGGYFVGVFAIYIGALVGPSVDLLHDIMNVSIYALGGIAVMFLSSWINDHLIFRRVSVRKEIKEKHNIAAAIVQLASLLASGLMIAGAIKGEGGGPLQAFVFYFIGQIFLILFTKGYIKFMSYDIQNQIHEGNIAVAFSVAGKMISIGIIVMMAIGHDFLGWNKTFIMICMDGTIMIFLLLIVSYFFDKLIIPKSDLDYELVEDKNIGVGVLDFCVNLMVSLLVLFLF